MLSGGKVLEALPAKLRRGAWGALVSSLAGLRPPAVKASLVTRMRISAVSPMFPDEDMAGMRRLFGPPFVDKATTRCVRRIDLRSDPTDTHKKV